MVLEGALEAARGTLVRRGGEMVGDAIFDRGSRMMAADVGTGASFSTGATAMIALTSAVVGGLAGWALHDIFKGKRR
jgi:hypothetical protein